MNTGQMLITMGAMFLLGIVIIRVNTGFSNTSTVLMDSKFAILGVSLANSTIEEANALAFDEKTDSNTISNMSNLSHLGPDGGESYGNFDDFDDFDGLVKIDSSMPSAIFKIECKVDYVDDINPDSALGTNSWNKRLRVTVTSESLLDTIEMSSIYSYFYFR